MAGLALDVAIQAAVNAWLEDKAGAAPVLLSSTTWSFEDSIGGMGGSAPTKPAGSKLTGFLS